MQKHPDPLTIKRLDHLGIVAGVIDEIGLVEKIDELIPPAPQRIVSCGNAVKAMISMPLASSPGPSTCIRSSLAASPSSISFGTTRRPG